MLRDVSLADKFDLDERRVFISGSQAILRLVLMQKERDRRAGLNTAGFVTGYRGSPLGGIDQQFYRAGKMLAENDIVFQPGLNEDLAATALWGSQQAGLRGKAKHDGVFGVWYGKGPGVDRSGDVFRHANFAGTARHGGVLALMGDDHTCESSTTAHQSEFAFVDAMMPVLNPAGVQEMLDYGLYGYALSRFAGVWVGLKCIKDNIESTGSIDASLDRISSVSPAFDLPPGGLNIRTGLHPLEQEALLHDYKKPAALAFLAAAGLDKLVLRGASPRLGIVSLGKSWLDVRLALDMLGLDEAKCAAFGVSLYKVAAPWPLEPHGVERFAEGLEEIVVVEEKRSLVETQIKEQLYGRAGAPFVVGKKDEKDRTLFPAKGALDANDVAIAIGERILERMPNEELEGRVRRLKDAQQAMRLTESIAVRTPHFCAGCPHNSSTHVPEGSRAYAGIGCHYMVQWMDRSTDGFTQMGGEGANWIGEAPFVEDEHVFQNLGDGTYNHSGYLALRAAKAAGVNITYKILYNDAVAMTGGQPHEGALSVPEIAAQVAAEGASPLAIVSDEPEKYRGIDWPKGTTVHHRSELDEVQERMREAKGLSVMIYDQTCAAEKRRRRKRGKYPDPDVRVFINKAVCEGCGDCSVKSNCIAVQPVETALGRKREIDQSACNKDYSCLEGFCPSFVSLEGAELKRPETADARLPDVPEPRVPVLTETFGLIVTGVGGTGVVTVGAVLGMAAHLEGRGVGVIDMAGLAQKGGAVTTHMKLAPSPDDISSIRVGAEGADTVLACDIVVAGSQKVLSAMKPGVTKVFTNTHETYPGDFTRDADFSLPTERLKRALAKRAGEGSVSFVEANRIATRLTGDAIFANTFMMGFAWQGGGIPLSRESIRRAIEMNGVGVEANLAAFEWGRAAAHDLASVEAQVAETTDLEERPQTLEEIVAHRSKLLTAYQDEAYAERYRGKVAAVAEAERGAVGSDEMAKAVAWGLYKLMAIKDEYEVARLYADPAFEASLKKTFGDWKTMRFHLAPPLLSRRDRHGHLVKRRYGPWIMTAYRLLARMKGLRGTPIDIFGKTAERRWERALLADYERVVDELVAGLCPENHGLAVEIADYPKGIRGYGHVKKAHAEKALPARDALLERFRDGETVLAEAAE